MNLHRYDTKKIKYAAANIARSFEEQQTSWIDQALTAADLKFRDQSGRYWYYDLYEKDWYYHENTEWLLTSEAPDFLEGLTLLFPGEGASLPGDQKDLDDATLAVSRSPHQALEDGAGKIRADYLAGRLSAEDAELIALRHYLVDQYGLFWTIGLQSGEWYWMNDEGWERASTPPEEDQLLKLAPGEQCQACGEALGGTVICPSCGEENIPEFPDLSEDVYQRILDFLMGVVSVPEPITPPWDPPGSFPAGVASRFVRRRDR